MFASVIVFCVCVCTRTAKNRRLPRFSRGTCASLYFHTSPEIYMRRILGGACLRKCARSCVRFAARRSNGFCASDAVDGVRRTHVDLLIHIVRTLIREFESPTNTNTARTGSGTAYLCCDYIIRSARRLAQTQNDMEWWCRAPHHRCEYVTIDMIQCWPNEIAGNIMYENRSAHISER